MLSSCVQSGFYATNNSNNPLSRSCEIDNGSGNQSWNEETKSYNPCVAISCEESYHIESNSCKPNVRRCHNLPENVVSGVEIWNGTDYGICSVTSCHEDYELLSGSCVYKFSGLYFNNKVGMQILPDGSLKSWGKGSFGQTGTGVTTDQSSPYSVDLGISKKAKKVVSNGDSSCAILNDNSLKCWGLNDKGQLGIGTTQLETLPVAVNLGVGKTAKDLFLGGSSFCSILNDNSLKCWGANDGGQLGVGNFTNQLQPALVNLGSGRTVKKLAMTSSASVNTHCAILDNDSLKCWGSNNQGQIGDGSTTPRTTPYLVDLGAGNTAKDIHLLVNNEGDQGVSTCAILQDDSLKCWGYNIHGKLGVGDTVNKTSPTVVNLGIGRTIKSLHNNPSYATCAILDDNSVKCWGQNNKGQLATGNTTSSTSPVDSLLTGVKSLHSNSTNVNCAIMNDDSMRCWGTGTTGALGRGNYNAIVSTPGKVNVGGLRTVKKVKIGLSTTCIILDNDTLKCSGDNSFGTLGLSNLTPKYNTHSIIDLGLGRTVKDFYLDNDHSICALLSDDQVSCWGKNDSLQAGRGQADPFFTYPLEINY